MDVAFQPKVGFVPDIFGLKNSRNNLKDSVLTLAQPTLQLTWHTTWHATTIAQTRTRVGELAALGS